MIQTTPTHRWSPSAFVRAWEAGAFEDQRVELVEGEIWPVVIGTWHTRTTGRVIRALPDVGVEIMPGTLPSGESLPDPDCWVLRAEATPTGRLGKRLETWASDDVRLVVEVSDETVMSDLNVKTRVYGSAGYAVYWVVTPDVIYEHTEPYSAGYRRRQEYPRGTRIPVRYADTDLAVDDLIG